MNYSSNKEWYVIRVKSRYEKIVQTSLLAKGFSPLHLSYIEASKRKDRNISLSKPFFPGYMFVNVLLNAESHIEVLKTTGVIDLLKNSQGPIPVPEWQISNIIPLQNYSGKVYLFEEFKEGNFVRVTSGILEGLIGQVDHVAKDLIKIIITNIPGAFAVQIPPSYLEPIDIEQIIRKQ